MVANEIRHRARLIKDYGPVPDVVANEARLGQVFLNLLLNAVQALPEDRSEANVIDFQKNHISNSSYNSDPLNGGAVLKPFTVFNINTSLVGDNSFFGVASP